MHDHLAVGAGKDGHIYVVDRDSMGKINTSTSDNSNAYQDLGGVFPGGVWSMPAYFNNTVYYGPNGNKLMAFSISNALLSTAPASMSATTFAYPGATPSVSANGTTNGIVWAMQAASSHGTTAVLHAFDATNLATELYNTNVTDNSADKYVTPMVANGKVYVGTPNAVVVFGLLNP